MTDRREKLLLGAGIAVFILAVFTVAIFKYLHFGYNAFDLAIYNQTFWNTIRGNWFAVSIHPPSYLGDHAEWLILALAPFYALIPHPLTLVFLKIIAVAAAAVPLWLIAKLKFNDSWTRLLFPFIWLANPYVWNMALFEFHLITFAAPLTILAAYFYLRGRWLSFLISAVLILLVREDMAFIVIGFALLAAFDILRRQKRLRDAWRWVVIPIVLAVAIFVVDQKVITYFNPDGAYKFFVFYEWLGKTPLEMITNTFAHPVRVFLHLLKPVNLELVIALLLPAAFLPLARPRFLLIILITTAEYMLTKNGADLVIIKSQYAAAFLPAVTLAAIEGYEYLLTRKQPFRLIPRPLAPLVVAVATVYVWFAFGPGIGLAKTFAPPDQRAQALAAAAVQVPEDASVVASMDMLTAFSSRQYIWPMSYVWIGKKQFGTSDYILPQEPDYLVIDQRDFVYYAMVYPQYAWSTAVYPDSPARFRALLTGGNYGTIFNREGIAVLKKGAGGPWPSVTVYATTPPIAHPANIKIGPLLFRGWERPDGTDETRLFFSSEDKIAEDIVLNVNGKYYPLGNGIYPAPDWKAGETVMVALPITDKKITVQPETIMGGLSLASDGSIYLNIKEHEPVGGMITIQ